MDSEDTRNTKEDFMRENGKTDFPTDKEKQSMKTEKCTKENFYKERDMDSELIQLETMSMKESGEMELSVDKEL